MDKSILKTSPMTSPVKRAIKEQIWEQNKERIYNEIIKPAIEEIRRRNPDKKHIHIRELRIKLDPNFFINDKQAEGKNDCKSR